MFFSLWNITNPQQGALSYQAEQLQEHKVIEEQDASGEQCPPHVPQRLRFVHTCREKHSLKHLKLCVRKSKIRRKECFLRARTNAIPIPSSVICRLTPCNHSKPSNRMWCQTGFSCFLTAGMCWRTTRRRHLLCSPSNRLTGTVNFPFCVAWVWRYTRTMMQSAGGGGVDFCATPSITKRTIIILFHIPDYQQMYFFRRLLVFWEQLLFKKIHKDRTAL